MARSSNRPGTLAAKNMPLVIAPTLAERAVLLAAVHQTGKDARVCVQACGMGPRAVDTFCAELDEDGRIPAAIALLGWAGGLHPSLSAGDIVVADSAVDTRGEVLTCSSLTVPSARVGPILTNSSVLQTREAKLRAWSTGAIAVDMEAFPLCEWANMRDVPFAHARVILDAAGDPLPALGYAIDRFGRVLWRPLASQLAQKPRMIPDLARLAYRIWRLTPRLRRLAATVVDEWQAIHT
jgi:nucleoside phosphorylase